MRPFSSAPHAAEHLPHGPDERRARRSGGSGGRDLENFVYVMAVIYLLYFVRLYWRSITERRALSRFASALLVDEDLHSREMNRFQRQLKTMAGKDAGSLAKEAAETVVDLALVFDKERSSADLHEALMATKAKADLS